MRLPDEYEERGMRSPVTYTVIAVSVLVLAIFAIVFISNTRPKGRRTPGDRIAQTSPEPAAEAEMEFAEGQEDIETLYREHRLRSEDLDFWNMYEDDSPLVMASPTESPSPTSSHEPTDEELAADGEHVKVTLKDGTEEWMEISKKIPLYTYDFTNIKITAGKMEYYQDGEKSSRLGVELSKDSGEVDFETLKSNGVEFVLLRLGSRGYETGLLSLDENFTDNITKAQSAGLEVGVSFFSQAVTKEEAQEEAKFVTDNLLSYKINYPVVYDMEYIVNDKSRIEILGAKEKTEVAEAFLSDLEKAGHHTLIYGNKNWLLGEIEAERLLTKYDVLLNDQSPVPDYPYQFRMWKYAGRQKIAGVENETAYIISFVDYNRR